MRARVQDGSEGWKEGDHVAWGQCGTERLKVSLLHVSSTTACSWRSRLESKGSRWFRRLEGGRPRGLGPVWHRAFESQSPPRQFNHSMQREEATDNSGYYFQRSKEGGLNSLSLFERIHKISTLRETSNQVAPPPPFQQPPWGRGLAPTPGILNQGLC